MMELHEYQKRAANFMAKHPRCILSVDMGLGKTASVLHYLEWLKPQSVLIVAPKRVAETVWKQEAEKWELYYCIERMVIVHGTPAQRKAQWQDCRHTWKIVGRDNLQDWSKYHGGTFDVMVLDELTSYKSVTSKRSKTICSIPATRHIGLTGTFLANGAIDIYGQAAACGILPQKLNFYAWRAVNFRDVLQGSGLQFSKWKPTKSLQELLKPIEQYIFTLTSQDYLHIPAVVERTHSISLSKEERSAYDNLQSFLQLKIGGEDMTFDEAQKFAKLQQVCDGFVYDDEGGTTYATEPTKLADVAYFCERCAGENEQVLLFYAYKAEEAWLNKVLSTRGLTVLNAKQSGFLDKWNAHECDVLMAHPASAGHGLNLQHGGHIVVWSSLTYNYELYAQANARLARQGQDKSVQIHYFLAEKTIEEQQMAALLKKDKEQKQFLKLTKQ